MEEFVTHARAAGVDTIYTLVNWNDWALLRFFEAVGFAPAKTVNLELKVRR
jgi:N-acetylglutamate synthase-like GNAT family acetyltransferase